MAVDGEDPINLENKEFTVKIGAIDSSNDDEIVYINYGNFMVTEFPENDETNGQIRVVALDYMKKFDIPFKDTYTYNGSEVTISYPCTLKDYLQHICNQAGVELGTQSFANENFSVANNQFEGKTCRKVLQDICKSAYTWARIGQDNKLYLDFANDSIEEYQVVEYLRSYGRTQHIDTGFKPNQDTRVVIDLIDYTTNTGFIFGARINASSNNYGFLVPDSTQFRTDYNTTLTTIPRTREIRYLVDKNKNVTTVYRDGEQVSKITQNYATFAPNYNMYVFAVNNSGTPNNSKADIKLYSCQIYDDDILVRDFVPCIRKIDNVAGLFDKVGRTFYTNQGTGSFTTGSVIEGKIIYGGVTETITEEEYYSDSFKKANEYYGKINKITLIDRDIEGQEVSITNDSAILQDGEKELKIYDNYFAYTTLKKQELIQAGSRLFGLKYMPIAQLDLKGMVYLDPNDFIDVIAPDGTEYLTRPFNHTIDYQGFVQDSITIDGETDAEREYTNSTSPVYQNAQTEINVDRANQEIKLISARTLKVYDEMERQGLIVTQPAKAIPPWEIRITGEKTYDSGATVLTKIYTICVTPELYPYISTEDDEILLTEDGEELIYSAHKYDIECDELLRKDATSDTITIDENRNIILTKRIGIQGRRNIYPR